jgi:hypothetical protein
LSVYSIYKETHSSDGSATHERHYAGWAADRDDAILRANELYEGRDSIEAVVVIGNGSREVEVVYRLERFSKQLIHRFCGTSNILRLVAYKDAETA